MTTDSLTSFIEEVSGDSHLRVEDDLGDGFVRLRRSEAERRQAKHDIRCVEDIVIEMLRNARDAGARHIFVATTREANARFICMIDDGQGVPPDMHQMIFEPRVTSKLDTMHMDKWGVHGRGMALYSIISNAEKAYIVDSNTDLGSAFMIEVNLTKISEKTDQSTAPRFVIDEAGEVHVRGPHNINRTIAEFAYESGDTCEVFHGSPADIVATLYAFGEATLSKNFRTFCNTPDELPLVKRICLLNDPEGLALAAEKQGLHISSRTARRILDGEIRSLNPVGEGIVPRREGEEQPGIAQRKTRVDQLTKDARGLKIHEDDLGEFSLRIKRAYENLAEAYYLEGQITPEIKVSSESINIKIPLSKLR